MALELLVERYNNISFLYIEDLGQFFEGSPLKRLLENNKLNGITFEQNTKRSEMTAKIPI